MRKKFTLTPEEMNASIGRWMRRRYERSNYQITRFHKIESVLNDHFVTHCGKRMLPDTGSNSPQHLEFLDDRPLNPNITCVWCS